MQAIQWLKVLLILLEFLEFASSPIVLSLGLWLGFTCWLVQSLHLNDWTATLFSMALAIQLVSQMQNDFD